MKCNLDVFKGEVGAAHSSFAWCCDDACAYGIVCDVEGRRRFREFVVVFVRVEENQGGFDEGVIGVDDGATTECSIGCGHMASGCLNVEGT